MWLLRANGLIAARPMRLKVESRWPSMLRYSDHGRRDAMNVYSKVFFAVVQIFLALSSLGKIVGAARLDLHGRAARLVADPLFSFLDFRQMLLLAVVLEVFVVVCIWRSKSVLKKSSVILWLTSLFAAYRLGLKAIGFKGYCPCLGYWATWLNLSERQVNTVAVSFLVFMATGSILIVTRDMVVRRRLSDLSIVQRS